MRLHQPRHSFCFNCNEPETLLVRHILTKSVMVRGRPKTGYHFAEEKLKRVPSRTMMFVCVNTQCWRHVDPKKLMAQWQVKVWRKYKISPPLGIVNPNGQIQKSEPDETV